LLQLHAEDAASRLQHLEEGVHGRCMEGKDPGHADDHRRADRCYPTTRRARRCTPARGRIWGSIDPPILLPTPVRPVAHLICSIASLTQMVHAMSITHHTVPLLVALLRWIFQNLMGGSPRCHHVRPITRPYNSYRLQPIIPLLLPLLCSWAELNWSESSGSSTAGRSPRRPPRRARPR
jgi:hypothetical protein